MIFFGFDVQGSKVHVPCTLKSQKRYIFYYKGCLGTFGSTRRVCTQHVHVRTQITRLVYVKNTYTFHTVHTLRGISHLPTHQQQQQDPRLQTFSWTT
jgi:hypothetical protein